MSRLLILLTAIATITVGGYAAFKQQHPSPHLDAPKPMAVAAATIGSEMQTDYREIAEASPNKQTQAVSSQPAEAVQASCACDLGKVSPQDSDENDDEDEDEDDDDEDDDEDEPATSNKECTTCDQSKQAVSQDSKEACKDEDLVCEEFGIWGIEGWSLKLRGGAFVPMSQRFREAYRWIGPDIEAEASIKFPRDPFEAWANINSFFQRNSNRHGCKRVGNMVNFSFGLKFSYRVQGEFEPYFGLGPNFGWLDIWVDNSRPCSGQQSCNKWVVGAVLKSGVYFYLTPSVFIDLYLDYLYLPNHWRNIDIDVGGIRTGVGLGVSF